ncbi:MAG: T9SS type A sorting domain-containing protein, partial [Bacteroidetes bacterium]|nr:T9SS type A sorting domain-containing protein [Bacteroidota bacterium]
GTNGNSIITIYDLLGKQLISSKQTIKNGKNVIMLNTTSLSNGIYIVSLELNELKKTQKIIINK